MNWVQALQALNVSKCAIAHVLATHLVQSHTHTPSLFLSRFSYLVGSMDDELLTLLDAERARQPS